MGFLSCKKKNQEPLSPHALDVTRPEIRDLIKEINRELEILPNGTERCEILVYQKYSKGLFETVLNKYIEKGWKRYTFQEMPYMHDVNPVLIILWR